MSGELDYELTRAKFKPWSAMPFGADYSSYRKRGELLALYKDGTTRLVGSNPNGGFDYKTLDDEKMDCAELVSWLTKRECKFLRAYSKNLCKPEIEKSL